MTLALLIRSYFFGFGREQQRSPGLLRTRRSSTLLIVYGCATFDLLVFSSTARVLYIASSSSSKHGQLTLRGDMARRSSARLRAKTPSTPQVRSFLVCATSFQGADNKMQPQKVSYPGLDGAIKTPKTMPKLSSLDESDEMPGAFPHSASPADRNSSSTNLARHIATATAGGRATPKSTTPIKPSLEEMHPQKFQMSTAKPLEEARWLGFSRMAPHTEPPKGASKIAVAQGTPTKTPRTTDVFNNPPDFQFTFDRPSLDLSPEARKLMAEKKEEAIKIREQMVASGEGASNASDVLARKMATPRSKVGRFSDVHLAQFKKMDSIADHPSVHRLEHSRPNIVIASAKKPLPKPQPLQSSSTTTLKRTQSKAELGQPSSALPRPTSRGNLQPSTSNDSPAKRVKRSFDDDASASRPKTSDSDSSIPTTPKHSSQLRMHASNPHLAKGASTPTAASLARAGSIKSVKRTGIPALSGLSRSPSKVGLAAASTAQEKVATPMLSRSPSKMTLTKPKTTTLELPELPESPLLSRSPLKAALPAKPAAETDDDDAEESSKIPYLSRSPSKMSVADHGDATEEKSSKTPLLARSPSKIAIAGNPFSPEKAPAQSIGSALMSRFNLLRQSPKKSILRTPQRLYSDDPAKLASGTHFATPPKAIANMNKTLPAPPKTAPVQKHVDFTASTKGLNDPNTPTKTSFSVKQSTSTITSIGEDTVDYPALVPDDGLLKKKHRRMTMALPSDFTFRAGGGITFAPSPNRASTIANLKASIRHVSAEPEVVPTHGKKRKLSDTAAAEIKQPQIKIQSQGASDKENDEEDEARPIKKSRPNAPEPQSKLGKTPTRVPTLGVKPKNAPKEKRPGVLSQARLAMLAAPKRRRE